MLESDARSVEERLCVKNVCVCERGGGGKEASVCVCVGGGGVRKTLWGGGGGQTGGRG